MARWLRGYRSAVKLLREQIEFEFETCEILFGTDPKKVLELLRIRPVSSLVTTRLKPPKQLAAHLKGGFHSIGENVAGSAFLESDLTCLRQRS